MGEWPPTMRAASIGVLYGALAFGCLMLSRFGAAVESLWLSNALLAAMLARAPRADWAVYFAAAALGHVSAHLLASDPLPLTLAFLAGDMAECLLLAVLFERRPGTLALRTRHAVVYFLGVCCLVAPLVSAACAALASRLIGAPMAPFDMLVWFAADALALALFAPIFYGLGDERWRDLFAGGVWLKVLLGAAAVAALATAGAFYPGVPTLRVMVLPLMVLIGFWIGVVGVETSLVALAVTWIGFTLVGQSPLPALDNSAREQILAVQALLAVFTATVLPLAVVVEEKQRLTDQLSGALHETRAAWGAIIAGEARYRLVADHVSEAVLRVAPDGRVLFASPAAASLIGRALEGEDLFANLAPIDAEDARALFDHTCRARLFDVAQAWTWRLRGAAGTILLGVRATLIRNDAPEFVIVLARQQDGGAMAAG